MKSRLVAKRAQDAAALDRGDQRFEPLGDFVGRCAGRKAGGGTDVDCDFAEVGEAAVFALHLPDAVEAHWDNRDAKIPGKEADAPLKRGHAAILGIVHFAFGKNQHAVAAVDGFAHEAKAFAEAGKLRQRENVEEQGGEPIAKLIGPAFGEKPIARWKSHVL